MWESQWRHCKATSFLLLLTCTFSPRKLNHRRLAAGVSRGGGGRDWGEKGVWGAKWQAGSFQSCHMTQDPVQMQRKRSPEWQLFHLECLANICLYRMQFFSCPGSSIPTLAQSVTATLDFGKKRVTFGTVSQRSVGGRFFLRISHIHWSSQVWSCKKSIELFYLLTYYLLLILLQRTKCCITGLVVICSLFWKKSMYMLGCTEVPSVAL